MTSSRTSPTSGGFKVADAFLAVAVAISAGVPGLLPFDVTGLTRVYGLINISSEWRLAVYGVAAAFALAVTLLWSQIVTTKGKRGWEALGLTLPLLFFAWTAATTIFTVQSFSDLALAYYRILEWGLTILVVWHFISAGADLKRFEQLVRAVSLAALIVVLAMLVVLPDVAQTHSNGLLGLQLGGSAYHPNYLAVLLALGAMYWWTTSTSRIRYFVAPIMLLCWLITGSRSGILGGAAAMLALALLQARGRDWVDRIVLRSGIVALVLLAAVVLLPEITNVLSRGNPTEDLSQLNSRTLIWPVALDFIGHSPWFGHGFIVGPKAMSDHFPIEWLAPSHAHNDFLNAAVASGIPGAMLLGLVYLAFLVRAFRLRNMHPLLCVTGIPIALTSFVEPIVCNHPTVIAVIVIGLVRTLAIVDAKQRHGATQRAAFRQRRYRPAIAA